MAVLYCKEHNLDTRIVCHTSLDDSDLLLHDWIGTNRRAVFPSCLNYSFDRILRIFTWTVYRKCDLRCQISICYGAFDNATYYIVFWIFQEQG